MEKTGITAICLIALCGAAFAAANISGVNNAVSDLNCQLQNMPAAVSMLMIIAAGLAFFPAAGAGAAYALFRKEGGNKAKYSKWAAMIFGGIFLLMAFGAIMGILIVIFMPAVLSSMYGLPAGAASNCA